MATIHTTTTAAFLLSQSSAGFIVYIGRPNEEEMAIQHEKRECFPLADAEGDMSLPLAATLTTDITYIPGAGCCSVLHVRLDGDDYTIAGSLYNDSAIDKFLTQLGWEYNYETGQYQQIEAR